MNSEELKDRVKDDLGQMLEAHGIKADISEHHVEKLNASYEALSITPEGISKVGISSSTLAKMSKGEVVSMEILIKICAYFECDFGDIVSYIKKENRHGTTIKLR